MIRSGLARAALPLALVLLSSCQQSANAAAPEQAVIAPAALRLSSQTTGLQTAIFAGGCFWGVEGVFSHVKGVTSAVSGYQGGAKAAADYERVSTGITGHAESVKVTFDPAVVRYDQLVQIFFSVIADPTTRNRQGPDSGTQYRSALVPLNPDQRAVAGAYLAQMQASGLWRAPIVTRLEDFRGFYPAEAYHQDFLARNPDHPYVQYWDIGKVAALKRLFPALYTPRFTRG
ncbi:MAG: peptide-methionine (S)-S-oxide reductase MsrA [Pseudomonadota bacterium]|jgi:peptide-methionine (S)-S-oxide reductase